MSSDWFSDPVSVPAVLVVRSLTASVSEYGEDVRVIGMSVCGFIVVLPADSRVSTRSPSRVPVRMCAVVSPPSGTLPLTRKVTSASPSCSETVWTVPTFMPDTVTSLPGMMPPASLNNAWYLTSVAMDSSFSG